MYCKRGPVLLFFLYAVGIGFCFSCKNNDKLSCAVGYNEDIHPMILKKCASISCHAQGTSLPDLSDFSVIKKYADNGRIETNVYELKIMPPASAEPLSDNEKQKLK